MGGALYPTGSLLQNGCQRPVINLKNLNEYVETKRRAFMCSRTYTNVPGDWMEKVHCRSQICLLHGADPQRGKSFN